MDEQNDKPIKMGVFGRLKFRDLFLISMSLVMLLLMFELLRSQNKSVIHDIIKMPNRLKDVVMENVGKDKKELVLSPDIVKIEVPDKLKGENEKVFKDGPELVLSSNFIEKAGNKPKVVVSSDKNNASVVNMDAEMIDKVRNDALLKMNGSEYVVCFRSIREEMFRNEILGNDEAYTDLKQKMDDGVLKEAVVLYNISKTDDGFHVDMPNIDKITKDNSYHIVHSKVYLKQMSESSNLQGENKRLEHHVKELDRYIKEQEQKESELHLRNVDVPEKFLFAKHEMERDLYEIDKRDLNMSKEPFRSSAGYEFFEGTYKGLPAVSKGFKLKTADVIATVQREALMIALVHHLRGVPFLFGFNIEFPEPIIVTQSVFGKGFDGHSFQNANDYEYFKEPIVALRFSIELLQIVHGFHEKGILHNWLIPANLVVVKDQTNGHLHPWIIGYTSAGFIDDKETIELDEDEQYEWLSSYTYLDPEFIQNGRELDPSSDGYSLGVLLKGLNTETEVIRSAAKNMISEPKNRPSFPKVIDSFKDELQRLEEKTRTIPVDGAQNKGITQKENGLNKLAEVPVPVPIRNDAIQ